RGEHSNGNYGWFGSGTVGAGGISSNGNIGYVGHTDFATWGRHSSGNKGYIGSSDYGVYGESNDGGHGYIGGGGFGVVGESSTGHRGLVGGPLYGVRGDHTSGNVGLLGTLGAGVRGSTVNDYAGIFTGDVLVNGTLSKSGGSFKIDHPLDPANKTLSHSFVESPDMMNVYNGNVTTDEGGEAVVTLPDYFEALNRDFRYQLTTIGGFAPVYIAEEISGNTFKIAGGTPGMKVSWQVTGIRQDAWAEANRIVVEEDKPAKERGFYLHPKLFGEPEERSVEWARDPEIMRELQAMTARLKDDRSPR
ncbi:MAG TPA: hypothetical protein VKP65_04305, partial [Rhodothermales bacterium]|nr:hypothetical protein [Rhodothermales bacterium]